MYKQRNNFSILDVPSANKQKILAKEILSSLMNEALSINDLNALYQNKDIQNKQQPAQNITAIPNTNELTFATLASPQEDEAKLKKTYDDTLLLGISKPFKIVFTDLQSKETTQPEEAAMEEDVQVLDDEVLVPMDAKEKEIEKEDDNAKEPEKEKEDGDIDYDFLLILPSSEVLPKELIAAVNKAGQGMISNPIIQKISDTPIGSVMPVSKIQSVEDDIEGYSVAGLDNPIAMKLMKEK